MNAWLSQDQFTLHIFGPPTQLQQAACSIQVFSPSFSAKDSILGSGKDANHMLAPRATNTLWQRKKAIHPLTQIKTAYSKTLIYNSLHPVMHQIRKRQAPFIIKLSMNVYLFRHLVLSNLSITLAMTVEGAPLK